MLHTHIKDKKKACQCFQQKIKIESLPSLLIAALVKQSNSVLSQLGCAVYCLLVCENK